jgi:hypothetical protein
MNNDILLLAAAGAALYLLSKNAQTSSDVPQAAHDAAGVAAPQPVDNSFTSFPIDTGAGKTGALVSVSPPGSGPQTSQYTTAGNAGVATTARAAPGVVPLLSGSVPAGTTADFDAAGQYTGYHINPPQGTTATYNSNGAYTGYITPASMQPTPGKMLKL